MKRALRSTALIATTAVLAGCASVGIDEALKDTNVRAQRFTGGNLVLSRTPEQRDRRAVTTRELLAGPLSQNDAVQLALANSPAVQALIARSWGDIAAARQTGRLPNPIFTFERMRLGSERELGRMLSFGLVDLILWPQRLSISRSQVDQARLQLTSAVVDQVTQVRQALGPRGRGATGLAVRRAGEHVGAGRCRTGPPDAAHRQFQQAAAGTPAGVPRRCGHPARVRSACHHGCA